MTSTATSCKIRKNGSTHVMLLVLKFYNKPITFDDMYAIAPKKITVNNRRRCSSILVENGYAVERIDDAGESWFMITRAGIDRVYELADGKSR